MIQNADIAAVFQEIADLLEIDGANPFRIRAYRNAARVLNTVSVNVPTLLQTGQAVPALPGIGQDLAAKMVEIAQTGRCALLQELRQLFPATLRQLLDIPGLGPKRVKTLYHGCHIQTLEQLAKTAAAGQLRALPGFGARTEQRIAQAVQTHLSKTKRFKLAQARPIAASLVGYLRAACPRSRVEIAGSLRRHQETVGDIDIVASAPKPAQLLQQFITYEAVEQVLSRGSTRASVILRQGIQVDLRVVAQASFGAAWYYFTGSKAHNIAVRRIAQQQGLKINEYGVFSDKQRIAGKTEAEIFAAVGLPYIAPELRENRGEIAAARQHALPDLVCLADLRGDLHAHTHASDGHNTLPEMAREAQRRGLSYLAITEHSQRLKVARGLDSGRLSQQIDEIDRLNAQFKAFVLLKGIEVDINEDGTLDLPDAILRRLDLVVGAVHSQFGLSKEQQTQRILRAMDHPCFTLLAHPGGRLLGEREPYAVDMPRIIRHARQRGCFLELNAQPERLDLTDLDCLEAKHEGVLISIDSDAHSVLDFDYLDFGIGQARRGWLEKKDVLNTRSLSELRALLARVRL